MYRYHIDPAFIRDKLSDLEDRSRGNNLRVDSIKERPNETWENCENELDTLFQVGVSLSKKIMLFASSKAL